ncbi:TetR/AcrR family transcriptional regulator [Agrococcus sp. ARC_14]|uniref:TetR/AcrR family transcriptional regulator n=1 Tax=Agrococcus sp. ARC_14 TaxID=2919927 RepID=UPI001F0588CB|nr:TetR/AcrR family transcriptional regulator [Agrococcus sp. ARC_14]MCH1882669.1 TetR/AcrR family transcriptional regulator [Agrococcus sp. ARC_14]
MPRPLIPHRRERILAEAESLILAHGFDAVSVQAIADRVGIAKGAVYREFASKDAVLEALLQASMARMTARSSELVGERPRLSAAYRASIEVLLDEPLMVAAFLDDAGVLGSYAVAVRDGRYRERMLEIVRWIAELQERGELDAGIDAEALGLALSSTTLGLLTAAQHLGPLSREQLAGAIGAMEALVSGLEPAAPNAIRERRS